MSINLQKDYAGARHESSIAFYVKIKKSKALLDLASMRQQQSILIAFKALHSGNAKKARGVTSLLHYK